MSRLRKAGFTLVELLIVVAIIGILSTIGIPTFKRMVQKAKKSEAKVGLGGVYTAEAAFFSEYGSYGSNLDKIGFELEGSLNNRFYTIGFPRTGSLTAFDAHRPLVSTTFGTAINLSFPGFYGSPTSLVNRRFMIRPTMTSARAGQVADGGNTFTASASGIIAPGFTFAADTSLQDQWTINEERQLTNIQDGVQ